MNKAKPYKEVRNTLIVDYKQIVDRILHSNEHIRFVTICTLGGKIEHTAHNPGITKYLTSEESQLSLKQAVKMWKTRFKLSEKIGKGKFAVVGYEKIKRITIPMGDKHLIYITMGTGGSHADVIEAAQKSMPSERPPEILKETKEVTPQQEKPQKEPKEKPTKPAKQNKPELTNPLYWGSKREKIEAYERDYLARLEQEQREAKKNAKTLEAREKAKAAKEAKTKSSTVHGTLPKGFKPAPKEEPKPAKRADRGSLPKGFK